MVVSRAPGAPLRYSSFVNATRHDGLLLNGAVLRQIRLSMYLSQKEMAEKLREAGESLGESNGCTQGHVEKWENEKIVSCRPNYRRAFVKVTGLPFASLCHAPAVLAGDSGDGAGSASPVVLSPAAHSMRAARAALVAPLAPCPDRGWRLWGGGGLGAG